MTNAKILFTIEKQQFVAYNLKTTITEARQVTYKDSKGRSRTRIETSHRPGLRGLLLAGTSPIAYPGTIEIADRKYAAAFDSGFSSVTHKLKYELAAPPFNEQFKVRVSTEDGPALRKAFQPRTLLAFSEVAKFIPPFILSSVVEEGLFMGVQSMHSSRNDMPLNLEKVHKFFTNAEYAKQALDEEYSYILGICRLIESLAANEALSLEQESQTTKESIPIE
ncbi:unnamed protein product [Didymodactylos carnosus]|uniref:Uncharacterized protein n=1 Tax=Didymodactylos carnosus TaxID=1234261 RepID=A0A8S2D459_9BILA|nr:unnamed protein product [Didymodactylos carnosus]CAF3581081.1 unnamed protein product [Didymodactylos carnosus]